MWKYRKLQVFYKTWILWYSCINCINFIIAIQLFALWKHFEIVNIQNPTLTVCFGLFSSEWGEKLKKSAMI